MSAVAALKWRMSAVSGLIGNSGRGFGKLFRPACRVPEPVVKPSEERVFAHIARVFLKGGEHLRTGIRPFLFQCLAVLSGFIRKLRFEYQHPVCSVLDIRVDVFEHLLNLSELIGRVRLVAGIKIETDLFLDELLESFEGRDMNRCMDIAGGRA